MENIFFILKNFLKDFYQDIIRYFPKKLSKNDKQKLSETQIYPEGRNIIKVLNIESKQRLENLKLAKNSTAASIGTCFAEELSKYLKIHTSFLDYIDLEKNFFNFSANWGRVYTVKNLKQIINYSLTEDVPFYVENYNNTFFDPLREHSVGNFESKKDLINNIKSHRLISRDIFSKTNLLVITLGQNEFWFDNKNKIAWGSTPSLTFRKEENRFKPIEYSFNQNLEDLNYIIKKLKEVNSKINIIFSVSPVAEYATFISDNIVSQSFACKCILRATIHEILPLYKNIYYFPSFEFVLSDNPNSFISDNRHVKRFKVSQILSSLNNSLLKK